MPTGYNLYFCEDHSDWWRSMRAHFLSKGVTSDSKVNSLCVRWIKQKGYRLPITAAERNA